MHQFCTFKHHTSYITKYAMQRVTQLWNRYNNTELQRLSMVGFSFAGGIVGGTYGCNKKLPFLCYLGGVFATGIVGMGVGYTAPITAPLLLAGHVYANRNRRNW
jgi:hypothetical protein